MTRRAIVRTLLCALTCLTAFCDTRDRTVFQFQHSSWTGREGVPARISALAQTSDGYLWLGTASGLYRFDGVQFEHYELPSGGTSHSDHVYSLQATSDGGLWIGFRWGGAAFLKDGRTTNYGEAEGLTPGATVFRISVDLEGTVWAATNSGLARLVGPRWQRVGLAWGFAGKSAKNLLVDRDGNLWVATDETVVFLPRRKNVFQNTGENVSRVNDMVQAPDGAVWVTMSPDIARPIAVHAEQSHVSPPVIHTGMGILFDRAGSLWTTNDFSGVMRLPFPERLKTGTIGPSSEGVESFIKRDGFASAAMRPDLAGFPVMEDREGNIWVGTETGLDRFRPTNLVPISFPVGTTIGTLAAGVQGRDWTGFLWAPGGKSLVHTPERPPFHFPLDVPVNNSYRKADGTVWLAMGEGRGILRFGNGQFSRIPLPAGITRGFNVQAMTEDHSGNFWVSIIQYGVFERTKGVWVPLGNLTDLPTGVPLTLMTDSSGRVWFGYQSNIGVAMFDGKKVRKFSSQDGLQVIHVQAFFERGEHIWIGGERGLSLFDGSRFRMMAADGLTFGGITGIVETASGDLWLNAILGVIHVPAAEVRQAIANAGYRVRCEVFDSMDGLQGWASQPRPQPSAVETSDGRLWFLTSGGLFHIDPDHISRNVLPPPVFIRSADSAGKFYKTSAELSLPKGTRNLHISYTALSFSVPERVQFRYVLEGIDKSWQDPGNRREAFYTNLEPGHYRFRVIAANNDGVWNRSGAAWSFSIAPAYYQTLWFRASCLGLLLIMMAGVYQLRLRQIAQGYKVRLEERVGERTRIARDLHDTLLQSLQGLMLRLQVVDDLLPPGRAKEELELTLERGDNAIAEGRSAVHDLRSSTTNTNDLAEALRALGGELSTGDTAAFRLVVEGRARDLHPIIRDELYQIAREALRNAFSHARASQIEAEITYAERLLRLRIRDNGAGIAPAILQGGRSGHYGFPGMHERATQIGAKLNIWSGLGTGTEVDLSVAGSIAYCASPGRSRLRLFRKRAG
jgi:signal transduction histidine kinase/ligand-binding sensor domain-containing protein